MNAMDFADNYPGVYLFTKNQTYFLFETYLDDRFGEIIVCGRHYYASEILRELDKDFYDSEFDEWFKNSGLVEVIIDTEISYAYREEINECLKMHITTPN